MEGGSFRAEKPRSWSEGRFVPRPTRTGGPNGSFDLHTDGNRFAMAAVSGTDASANKIVFIFDFFDELRRIAPVKK